MSVIRGLTQRRKGAKVVFAGPLSFLSFLNELFAAWRLGVRISTSKSGVKSLHM